MISSAVFARYARALADVALEQGEEAAVERDLDLYEEIFRAVPSVLDVLDSPAIPRDAKDQVLSGLFANYPVSRTVANYLRILLDHHRIRYFAQVHESYSRIVNERKGIIRARVTSAAPLQPSELARLRECLSRITGKIVELSAVTDPDILAGVIVQIGSTIYDGSVRTQLDEMRRCLTRG